MFFNVTLLEFLTYIILLVRFAGALPFACSDKNSYYVVEASKTPFGDLKLQTEILWCDEHGKASLLQNCGIFGIVLGSYPPQCAAPGLQSTTVPQ
jgi:hypothetical protein